MIIKLTNINFVLISVHVADCGSKMDQDSFVEALTKETYILQKRVDAARSRALVATSFLPNRLPRNEKSKENT